MQRPAAVILFAPVTERQLARLPGASVGIMSASQGTYSPAQLLLDITQGARVDTGAYASPRPGTLAPRPAGQGAVIEGWGEAVARARSAPADLIPGLLASSAGGPSAYVSAGGGAAGASAAAAAGRAGAIGALSAGDAGTLAGRVTAMASSHTLTVADIPAGAAGARALRALARSRPDGELLIVIQRAVPAVGGRLLWTAIAGLPGSGGVLTSQSTREAGLISSVDIAPTVLAHAGLARPSQMTGRSVTGTSRGAALPALMARLNVISERRLPALAVLLAAWALAMLASVIVPAARSRVLRAGSLALMWAPAAALVPAGFESSAPHEIGLILLLCSVLGLLTDALIGWPRAVIAPALAAVLAITLDAFAGSQLLMRSLIGPDPILGARFYGVGNELKAVLAVLVLAGVAGVLHPSSRGRRGAAWMFGAGAVLAVIEGSALVGAAVGGVILVCAAFAVAGVMMLPGRVTRRRALIVILAPFAGLAVLAVLDLLFAGGSGHFTGSVLDASSPGDLRDVISRRYGAAGRELVSHAMPLAAALALALAVLGVLRRERLLAPVAGDPAWAAALAGGLTAGVLGSLVEDSGPVLLVGAVLTLTCVAAYLHGRPRPLRHSPGTPPGSRSHALRPEAEPARSGS